MCPTHFGQIGMKRRKNVEKSDKYECDIGRIIIKKRNRKKME